jgi:TrkA domain protein
MEVFETRLPGVGMRYEFTTTEGEHVGVLVRRDGRREVAMYDRRDPDTCRAAIALDTTDAAELLGGTKVTERLTELRHEVEGLSIEWTTVPATGALTERTIGDGRIRSVTGASVVAVIRGDRSIPGPGPDLRLEAGDIVLLMGEATAVQAGARLLGA